MTFFTSSVLLLAALVAGAALSYIVLASRLRRVEAERERQEERLASRDAQIARDGERLSELDDEIGRLRQSNGGLIAQSAALAAQLEAERRSAQEKLEAIAQAEARLKETFQALSAEVLKSSNESFLELARTQLERFQETSRTDLDQRREAVENLVKPIAETLEKVDSKLQEVEKGRVATEATLKEHLLSVQTTQLRLQAETANLVKALRAPNVRGRWGEIQLKRVVEVAGMLEYCDFTQQDSLTSDDGVRRRPDMVVRLPSGRSVVVDSKVPLTHYLDALETSDEDTRVQRLREHAAQVKRHLAELSGRAYWDALDGTPEFVVLFLPGETFFSAALEQDPSLIEYGVEQRVILATPTTLIALLKAVAYGWRQEQIAANAKEISELGRTLYDRVRTMAGHLVGVGKGLNRAIEAYNSGVGSLEKSVLPAVRRFRDLRAAAGDEIPQLEPIDKVSREFAAPELVVDLPEEVDELAPAAAVAAAEPPDLPRRLNLSG